MEQKPANFFFPQTAQTNPNKFVFCWWSRYRDSNNEWHICLYLSTQTEYITVWVFRLLRPVHVYTRVCVATRVQACLTHSLLYQLMKYWHARQETNHVNPETQWQTQSCHTLMTVKKIDAENCLSGLEIYETPCGNFLWEVVFFFPPQRT